MTPSEHANADSGSNYRNAAASLCCQSMAATLHGLLVCVEKPKALRKRCAPGYDQCRVPKEKNSEIGSACISKRILGSSLPLWISLRERHDDKEPPHERHEEEHDAAACAAGGAAGAARWQRVRRAPQLHAPLGHGPLAGHAVHGLVHENEWGTLATISKQFNGVPFANIVSYSDGVGDSAEASTGEIFFYLTPMDSTASDLAVNPSASMSISMAQGGKGACKMDVEDPTCWKLSFTGTVMPVPADKEEYAKKALFSKHPQMKYWPSGHGFKPYVLKPENIVLLDYYGGAKHIPVDEYYSVKLRDESDDDMEQRFRVPEYYRIKH